MNELVLIAARTTLPAIIAAAGERASLRFLEFFAANIRNPHTRRAYGRAVAEFMTWCNHNGVTSITTVQPLHVSAWIEQQAWERAAPTAKLRLTTLRHLFDPTSTLWTWFCRDTQGILRVLTAPTKMWC
jgi:Phage integrase, N-terminal SAM-like domain